MSNAASTPPSNSKDATLSVVQGISAFTREEWHTLSGTSHKPLEKSYNPFICYDFLQSLEKSNCVSESEGWLPQYLRLEAFDGSLIGAVPCYLKSHSQGEYVFDHSWADAFERAGGHYYPKLQASVPFTPATGPRLLVHNGFSQDAIRTTLAQGLKAFANQLGISSTHVTFVDEQDCHALIAEGFLHRTDQQFHFFNEDYADYDDFLSNLASRKRKALKHERREALAAGITIEWLTGTDITETVWDAFFTFYMDTSSRKWGRPYLNRDFFSLIGETMANDILLVMARRNGKYIAGAINFIGADTLYGRNWGCIEDHPYLHFEVCYHQAIDYALAHKLVRVEAGAQGEHKLARGYKPVTTHSAHYIAHSGLRHAVSDYLERERQEIQQINAYLDEHTPFKKHG